MKTMKELLERTSLRAMGIFLMNDEESWAMTDEAQTEKGLLESVYDGLDTALRRSGSRWDKQIGEAADAIRDAGWRLGFLAGMKAGARLVLSLTDESEIEV